MDCQVRKQLHESEIVLLILELMHLIAEQIDTTLLNCKLPTRP
jgi:hypothetical protein